MSYTARAAEKGLGRGGEEEEGGRGEEEEEEEEEGGEVGGGKRRGVVRREKVGALYSANHNHYTTAKAIHIFCGAGERNRGYALLMTANKPETVLYRLRAPTFSLLLASHGGIS